MILFDLATLTTLTLPSQGPRPHDGGRGPRRGPLVLLTSPDKQRIAFAPAPPLAGEKRPPLPSRSQVRRRCFVGACAPSTRRPHASPTDAQTQASHTAPPLSHLPGASLGAASSAARAMLRPSWQPGRRSSSHYESFALLSTTPLRRARGSGRLHLRRLALFTIAALNRRQHHHGRVHHRRHHRRRLDHLRHHHARRRRTHEADVLEAPALYGLG